FFFQAEDGIRDFHVTGVQTCALPILRLPKATVTTWIQNLEARLRVKLLNRTTRKVSVTADGAAYYERCLRILNEVEETESVLTQIGRASCREREYMAVV